MPPIKIISRLLRRDDEKVHGTGLAADEIGPIIACTAALGIGIVITLCLVKHKRGKYDGKSEGCFYLPFWSWIDCGQGMGGLPPEETAEEKASRLEKEVEIMQAEKKAAKRVTLEEEQMTKRRTMDSDQFKAAPILESLRDVDTVKAEKKAAKRVTLDEDQMGKRRTMDSDQFRASSSLERHVETMNQEKEKVKRMTLEDEQREKRRTLDDDRLRAIAKLERDLEIMKKEREKEALEEARLASRKRTHEEQSKIAGTASS